MEKQKNMVLKTGPHLRSFLHVLIAILIRVSALILLNQKPWCSYTIDQYGGNSGYRESSWILKEGENVLDPQVTLPSFRKLAKDTAYSISTKLTYDGRTDRVPFGFLYIHHMYCRILLDGQELYRYMPEDISKVDHAKSPGNVYISFPMPADCLGKEFTVEFVPPLNIDMDYELPFPVFGDYPSVAHRTFLKDLPHNLIAVLSGFIGIAAIAFATMALKGSEYREALFIGIFALLFSMYNITECNFNFYMISNPYYTYLLNYITFTLIPISLIAFLRERLNKKQKPVGTAMLIIGTLIFFTELIFHFSGFMDMREFLPILHISYFTELMIIFVLIITMRRNRWKKHLVYQMVPILIGMLLDAAVYYEHWKISSSDAAFTTIGVIIFLMIELYHVWRYSIEVYTESVRSQDFQKMAFIDSLTGVGNRRSFEAERQQVLNEEKSYQTLHVASADLNDLKITNDTLGHAAGDFIIRSAANVLSELCEDYGSAFRVGGDEFIVFLYDMDQEEFDRRIQMLHENVENINSNSQAKLSLALGWDLIRDSSLDAAVRRADRRMYEQKAQMKAASKK